jgi:hypothetical protein
MGLGEHTYYTKYILFLVINFAIKTLSYKIRVTKDTEKKMVMCRGDVDITALQSSGLPQSLPVPGPCYN